LARTDTPSSAPSPFRHTLRVYWEDTDAGGVVFYANYLKYFERAREELFEEHIGSLAELNRRGEVYVVVEMKCSFRAPARHGDRLVIESTLSVKSSYRAVFRQEARRLPDRIHNSARGRIKELSYFGSFTIYQIELPSGARLKVSMANTQRHRDDEFTWGDAVWAHWSRSAHVVLTR